MDERHRDHLKYVELVSGTKDTPSDDAVDRELQMDHLLQEIRDENYSSEYNMLSYFMISATVIVVILQYIQLGATLRLLVLALLPLFWIYNRAKQKSHAKRINQAKTKWALRKDEPSHVRTPLRAKYIRAGLDLNHSRISNTKWLYFLLTPFLMLFLLELGRGPFETKSLIILFVVALIANVVLWNYVFRADLEQIDEWYIDERLDYTASEK